MSEKQALTEQQQKVLESVRGAFGSIPIASRSCGECAKCCEGWLTGEVFGQEFYPGTPCFYLEKTCSIYEQRPVSPCIVFKCSWLSENTFPMWMKPSLIHSIIIQKEEAGHSFYEVVPAGGPLEERVLDWLIKWAGTSGQNLQYSQDGHVKKIGSAEFQR